MPDNSYEVKQSKKMIIIACISAGIFELLFLGLGIYFICCFNREKLTYDEKVLYILNIIIFIIFAIIIAVIFITILHTFFFQLDVYLENKLIRKKGGKIIFEISYKDITSIKQGYDSLFMVLKEPIVKINGKKGPRNFYEHYSEKDIKMIKRIIADSNYNLDTK